MKKRTLRPAGREKPSKSGRRVRALDGRNVRPCRGPAGPAGRPRPETPESAEKIKCRNFSACPAGGELPRRIFSGRATLHGVSGCAPPPAGQTFSPEASRPASPPGKRRAPEGRSSPTDGIHMIPRACCARVILSPCVCTPTGHTHFIPPGICLVPRRRRGPKKSFSLHPNGQQTAGYPSLMGGIILCNRQPNINST